MSEVNLSYGAFRSLVRFWINRFFRRILIQGSENIPKGAVLFAINHPNNLIDTLLVAYAIDRKVHYLATASLFRNKLLSLFLSNMGVIPVYRKQDDPGHSEKNVSAFEACYAVLKNGGAIGIYPEGVTHAEPRIRQIKTGAARIALEAENRFHSGICIVPVGLNYSARKSFRSEVWIQIGQPLQVASYVSRDLVQPGSSVEELTADLQRALANQTRNVEVPDLDRLVRQIDELYRSELVEEFGLEKRPIDNLRLSQRMIDGIHYFNRNDPARLAAIAQHVQSYQDKLDRAHLEDRMLKQLSGNAVSYRNFLIRCILLIAGFPFAIWGTLNHFLPYRISRWISRKIAKRETDYATARIVSSVLLYPLFYALQIKWTLNRYGWITALIYGSTLPTFGAFAYYYWEKFRILRSDLRLFYVLITRKNLVRQLQKRREKLISEMDRAREDYLNAVEQA
jgi:glycerol-3-phosphate O-acyltransferase / dihydroxyacetone phosphate acyltransferase